MEAAQKCLAGAQYDIRDPMRKCRDVGLRKAREAYDSSVTWVGDLVTGIGGSSGIDETNVYRTYTTSGDSVYVGADAIKGVAWKGNQCGST